jgi:hypothetical protein
MSALQAVENYLAELSFLTVAQNENAYVNPTAIVQDLQQAVIGEINEDQLGTARSKLTPGRQTCAEAQFKVIALIVSTLPIPVCRPGVLPHLHRRELHPSISREIGHVSGALLLCCCTHVCTPVMLTCSRELPGQEVCEDEGEHAHLP